MVCNSGSDGCNPNQGSSFKHELEQIVSENDRIVKENIEKHYGVEAVDKLRKLLERQFQLGQKKIDCPLLEPLHTSLLYNLGCAYEHIIGDFKRAIEIYREVVKLDPNHSSALYNLGTNSIKLGDYSEAEHYLKKAVDLNPTNLDYNRNYNHAYTCANRLDERLLIADALQYRSLRNRKIV